MTTKLIDGDIIVYKAGFAVERTIYGYWQDDTTFISWPAGTKLKDIRDELPEDLSRFKDRLVRTKESRPLSHALQAAKTILKWMIVDGCKYEIYLTSDDKSNYRYNIAKTRPYKGNRKQPKPGHYNDIREYLVREFNAIIVEDQEADDMIGIRSQELNDALVCSSDKDLKMLPGVYFDMQSGKTTHINPVEAYYNFCIQLITGDSTDNIVGLPGYGPVKAKKLLDAKEPLTEKDMLNTVWKEYKKVYEEEAEERLREMGKLLWIRRERGELWDIPKEILQGSNMDTGQDSKKR